MILNGLAGTGYLAIFRKRLFNWRTDVAWQAMNAREVFDDAQ